MATLTVELWMAAAVNAVDSSDGSFVKRWNFSTLIVAKRLAKINRPGVEQVLQTIKYGYTNIHMYIWAPNLLCGLIADTHTSTRSFSEVNWRNIGALLWAADKPTAWLQSPQGEFAFLEPGNCHSKAEEHRKQIKSACYVLYSSLFHCITFTCNGTLSLMFENEHCSSHKARLLAYSPHLSELLSEIPVTVYQGNHCHY